jgi:TonB family protein
LAFDLLSRAISRPRNPELLLLVATAAFACELNAQAPGRSTRIPLSDSMSAFIHLGSTDTSITAFTPEGIFRLAASSSALASWAKASAALPGPTPQSGAESNGKMSFSASILRASDESGNAMRLLRLSADSPSTYSLAGSNGAWEFSGRVPPEKVGVLLRALAGDEADGLKWNADAPHSNSAAPGFREAEPAPDNPPPRYPARAELGRASGEVLAQFTIDASGRARRESLLIVRSTHPLFSLAVRDALPSMRFLPATRWGVPVEMVEIQSFVFKIP